MRSAALVLLVAGCPAAEPEWALLADQVPGGVLLSAWTAGDDLLMVGGDLGGDAGTLATWDGEALCTENLGDRALWWIHGRSPTDWWAVGEGGRAVHVVDGVQAFDDVATEATLFGVFDDGATVWAVGGVVDDGTGEVWRNVGAGWEAVATDLPGLAFKVWEEWIVGDEIAYRIVGDELVEETNPLRLLTVRGRAADDVWAVGGTTSARVAHWEGQSWTEVDNALGQPLNGVWTAPGEDVWVAGNFGAVARWDGTAWHMPELPVTTDHLHAIYKHGDDVFAVGGNLLSSSDHYGVIARYGEAGDVAAVGCPSPN